MSGGTSVSVALEPSRRFGRYLVHERIGRGGMGEVWLASAEGPHGFRKKVVLKTVRPDLAERRDLVDMLIREAAIAARLNHPNIVQVFDLDCVDGTYFFAMEHVPGYTMADIVKRVHKRGGALPPWFLLGVISACCDGLQYAHELLDERGGPLGLVHRDISLGNIMVAATGNVTILDFGIAVSSAAELETESGMLKGKFQYMPPETIRGETIDRRCDIYGLGVVMYIATTGRVPYPDLAEYELLRAIVARPPPPISAICNGVPATVERIVEVAMAHDRADRYPDAVAMAAEVRDQLRGRGMPTADELARYVVELFGSDVPLEATGAALQLLTVPSGPPAEARGHGHHGDDGMEEFSISVDDLVDDSDDLAIPEASDAIPELRSDDAPSAKTTPVDAGRPARPRRPDRAGLAQATTPPPVRPPTSTGTANVTSPDGKPWGPIGLLPPISRTPPRSADPFATGPRSRPPVADDGHSVFDGWTRSVRRPDTEDPEKPPKWPWSR
jgi:serine/threonine protein kinase